MITFNRRRYCFS